ncbi:MAG: hypothetical protein JWL81_2945 [Verrucomicrobiales bacterium]|nr:hypothetical protein [Verrucomicrobiales bacterium]
MTDETELDEPERTPLMDALTYPIRGNGRYLMVTGAVLLALFDLASGAIIVGGAATLLAAAYMNAYYFDIVETTVSGRDEAPDWPDAADPLNDFGLPFLRMLFALLVSFGPLLLQMFLSGDSAGWGLGNWLLLLVGAIYFPMAILNIIISNEWEGAMPQRVVPRIIKAMPGYLGLTGLLLASLVASYALNALLGRVPFLGGLLSAGAWLYFAMAEARLAGLFYRRHLEMEEEAEDESGKVDVVE